MNFRRLSAYVLGEPFPIQLKTFSMTSIDLRTLQDELAVIDMLSKKPSNSRSALLEVLLKKHEQIKLKMYQELGHARPHFHVDYGPHSHSASFAVDTGQRIEGNLPSKYDKAIASWAEKNKTDLLSTWNDLQAGSTGAPFIQSLSALKG